LPEATRWYADSDIGRRYAKVCGDYNPIHLSAVSARLFGFPTAIAHGMWSKAMALAALRGHLPHSGYAFEVDFRKPVRLPSEVVLSASAAGPAGQLRLDGHGRYCIWSGGGIGCRPLALHRAWAEAMQH
jgi:acyl dehydratase